MNLFWTFFATIFGNILLTHTLPFPPSFAAPPMDSGAGATTHDKETHISKIGHHRQRMLNFAPDFEDELQGIQLLDSKSTFSQIHDPLAHQFETKIESATIRMHSKSNEKFEQKPSTAVEFPSTIERTTLLSKNSEDGIDSKQDQFQSNEMSEDKLSTPVKDSTHRSKAEQSENLTRNEKGVYTNRTSTLEQLPLQNRQNKTMSSPNGSTDYSFQLQRNDSKALQKLLMNTKNKSQDCLETQFEQPTSNPDTQEDVQNPKENEISQTTRRPLPSKGHDHVKPGMLNFPLKVSNLSPSYTRQISLSTPFSEREAVSSTGETEIVSTVVGIVLATIVTFAAAAWLSLEDFNRGTFIPQNPIMESRMSPTNPSLASPNFLAYQNYRHHPILLNHSNRHLGDSKLY